MYQNWIGAGLHPVAVRLKRVRVSSPPPILRGAMSVIYSQPCINSPFIWRNKNDKDVCCNDSSNLEVAFKNTFNGEITAFSCKICKKLWCIDGDNLKTTAKCQNWSHYENNGVHKEIECKE